MDAVTKPQKIKVEGNLLWWWILTLTSKLSKLKSTPMISLPRNLQLDLVCSDDYGEILTHKTNWTKKTMYVEESKHFCNIICTRCNFCKTFLLYPVRINLEQSEQKKIESVNSVEPSKPYWLRKVEHPKQKPSSVIGFCFNLWEKLNKANPTKTYKNWRIKWLKIQHKCKVVNTKVCQ